MRAVDGRLAVVAELVGAFEVVQVRDPLGLEAVEGGLEARRGWSRCGFGVL